MRKFCILHIIWTVEFAMWMGNYVGWKVREVTKSYKTRDMDSPCSVIMCRALPITVWSIVITGVSRLTLMFIITNYIVKLVWDSSPCDGTCYLFHWPVSKLRLLTGTKWVQQSIPLTLMFLTYNSLGWATIKYSPKVRPTFWRQKSLMVSTVGAQNLSPWVKVYIDL